MEDKVVEGEERLELEEEVVKVVEEEEGGRDPCPVIKPAGGQCYQERRGRNRR